MNLNYKYIFIIILNFDIIMLHRWVFIFLCKFLIACYNKEPIKLNLTMPTLTNYRLFVSHSWNYGDAYDKLVGFFNEHPNFKWSDYSVPKDDPIHNAPTSSALYEAIKNQVAPVNCVVILAGVYSSYSKWIKSEIQIAKKIYSKPVVAVEPWGSDKTSQIVKDNADAIVKWQSASIVSAIRKHSI